MGRTWPADGGSTFRLELCTLLTQYGESLPPSGYSLCYLGVTEDDVYRFSFAKRRSSPEICAPSSADGGD